MRTPDIDWVAVGLYTGVGAVGLALVGLVAYAIYQEAWDEAHEPDAGIITDMEYEPAEYELTTECITITDAKGRVTTQCTPESNYYPASWCVWYVDDYGSEGDDCLSSELYAVLDIGDMYTKGMRIEDAQ